MTAGFYGKIPATGDFVGRDLPRVLIQRWDRWMELSLRPALDAGGGDGGVPWAFVAARGIFGPEPVAGVWRLGRDRVGRRFPLLIALPGATPEPADPWYAEAAALVDAALSGGLAPQALAERVAALPRPGRRVAPQEAARFWPAPDPGRGPVLCYATIAELAREGLAAMLPPVEGLLPEAEDPDLQEPGPTPGPDALDALAALIETPAADGEPAPDHPGPAGPDPVDPTPGAETDPAGDPLLALLGEIGPAEPAAPAADPAAGPPPAPGERPPDPLVALLDWAAGEEPAAPPPPGFAADPEDLPPPLPEPEEQIDIDELFDLDAPDPGSPPR